MSPPSAATRRCRSSRRSPEELPFLPPQPADDQHEAEGRGAETMARVDRRMEYPGAEALHPTSNGGAAGTRRSRRRGETIEPARTADVNAAIDRTRRCSAATCLGVLFARLRAPRRRIGGGTAIVFEDWVYDAVMLGAAASCLLRAALHRRERAAWGCSGRPSLDLDGRRNLLRGRATRRPTPSPADAGYLLFYPIAYAGLIVLMRARVGSFSARAAARRDDRRGRRRGAHRGPGAGADRRREHQLRGRPSRSPPTSPIRSAT